MSKEAVRREIEAKSSGRSASNNAGPVFSLDEVNTSDVVKLAKASDERREETAVRPSRQRNLSELLDAAKEKAARTTAKAVAAKKADNDASSNIESINMMWARYLDARDHDFKALQEQVANLTKYVSEMKEEMEKTSEFLETVMDMLDKL